MDTKFSASYWGHREVEPATPEIKLAGAWMRTNDRLTLFGYAEVTAERFAFETGLPKEALLRAIQALPDWFTPLPKGYFVPGFIGEQIGRGEALLNNNVCKGLVRALVALHDAEVLALVLRHYPELQMALKVTDIPKPLATPTGGVREEKRREEQSREEQSGGDRGVGKEEPRRGRRRSAPGSLLPADQSEDLRNRMLEVGALKGRDASAAWTVAELEAFKSIRLASCSLEEFAAQVDPMRIYYRAKISREIGDYRRRELLTLLTNWPGELDKARAWVRDNHDGISKP